MTRPAGGKPRYRLHVIGTAFTMCVQECMRCGNSSHSALEVTRRFFRAYSARFYTSAEAILRDPR